MNSDPTALDWIPAKGLQQTSPVCAQDSQLEYFNCFPGSHDLFDLKRKGGRGNFFQAITTCYMCITTKYCAHIFQMYHTLKYLLDKTLTPVFQMQPTISSSIYTSIQNTFPNCPVLLSQEWERADETNMSRCLNSSSCGPQDTLGIWLRGMSALQPPLIASL